MGQHFTCVYVLLIRMFSVFAALVPSYQEVLSSSQPDICTIQLSISADGGSCWCTVASQNHIIQAVCNMNVCLPHVSFSVSLLLPIYLVQNISVSLVSVSPICTVGCNCRFVLTNLQVNLWSDLIALGILKH